MRAARGASHRAGLSSPRLPASPLLRRGLGVRRGPRCCPGRLRVRPELRERGRGRGRAGWVRRTPGRGSRGPRVAGGGGRRSGGVFLSVLRAGRGGARWPSRPGPSLPPCRPDRDPKFWAARGAAWVPPAPVRRWSPPRRCAARLLLLTYCLAGSLMADGEAALPVADCRGGKPRAQGNCLGQIWAISAQR